MKHFCKGLFAALLMLLAEASAHASGVYVPYQILPPTPTTLGGDFSKTCPAHQWFYTLGTDGTLACLEPDLSDLTGTSGLATQAGNNVFTGANQFGSPTGGNMGAGTVNASAMFLNGQSIAAPVVNFASRYNVTPASSDSAILTAWNAAISDCNAGTIGGWVVPDGTWKFPAKPNAITATTCKIMGDGAATQLAFDTSATDCQFFQLGTDAARAVKIDIEGLYLNYLNTPATNCFSIYINSATQSKFEKIWVNNASSLLHIGSATATLGDSQVEFKDFNADISNGGPDLHNIFIESAGNVLFRDFNMTGTMVANATPGSALFEIQPQPLVAGHTQESVDTIRCDGCGFQAFSVRSPPGSANGKPIGILIDAEYGDVFNDWWVNSFADHTTSSAILYENGAYGVGTGVTRVHHWIGDRFTPDAGACISFNDQSGVIVDGLNFDGIRCFGADTTIPIQIATPSTGAGNYKNDTLSHIAVEDQSSAGTILGAFQPNADGWTISDWKVGSATSATTTNFSNVFDITNAGLLNLNIGQGAAPTLFQQSVPGYIAEPTYTTPNSPGRQFWFPNAPGPLYPGDAGLNAYRCSTPRDIVYPSSLTLTASHTVNLEATCAHEGVPLYVYNLTTGSFNILVKDVASGATLATLAAGQSAQFEYQDTTHNWIMVNSASGPGAITIDGILCSVGSSCSIGITNLGNAGGDTVCGNFGATSGVLGCAINPAIGIPGTNNGSLTIGATAGGSVKIENVGSGTAWTWDLPASLCASGQVMTSSGASNTNWNCSGLSGLSGSALFSQLPAIASGDVYGNTGGSSAVPADSTLTSLLDTDFCNTSGNVLERGASIWGCLSDATTVGGTACALGGTCAPTATVDGQSCALGSSCTVGIGNLGNSGGDTVCGNNSASTAALSCAINPAVGIPGTNNGSLTIGATAGGSVKIENVGSGTAWTWDLPASLCASGQVMTSSGASNTNWGCGGLSGITGSVAASQLPNPTASTIGGVESVTCAAHQWIYQISTSGVPVCLQPAASDVSGLAVVATSGSASDLGTGTLPSSRLPVPTASTLGGVESIAAVSHQYLTGISTSGAPSQAQPSASDITGLANSATTDTTNASNITTGTLPSAQAPAGMEYVLGQSGIPFVMAGSGSVANNGALTLTTALGTTYASAYVYMPNASICAVCAQGWYYAVFSSTTAATLYNNTYTSGTPAIPGSPTAFSTTGPGAYTGASTSIASYQLSVPGNLLGANGGIEVFLGTTYTNSSASKTFQTNYGGYVFMSAAPTTTVNLGFLSGFRNRGATNAQVNLGGVSGSFTASATTQNYGTTDSTTSQNVTVKITNGTPATNNAVLEQATVTLLPGVL